MKLKILTAVVLGIAVLVSSEEEIVDADHGIDEKADDNKRFSGDKGQFSSYNDKNKALVDWNKALNKRMSGSGPNQFASNGGDGKLVDWSRMFKRFGSNNGANFGQSNNDKFMKWNSAFAKRFQGNADGFSNGDEKMIDWSSMYKRFGTDPDNSDLVDWSSMFQKNKRSKRSTSGFKRFRSDMSFVPETLKSGDFIDWSRVFSKRGFDGYEGSFGNPSRGSNMQDWRNLMAKRNFGSQNMGYFGRDGLYDNNLLNWNSLLDRKRRSTSEHEIDL